jgi:hypothetical protein
MASKGGGLLRAEDRLLWWELKSDMTEIHEAFQVKKSFIIRA